MLLKINCLKICVSLHLLKLKYIFLLLPVELFISLDCFGVELPALNVVVTAQKNTFEKFKR